MRTTINLDDDILRAAKELASLSGRSLGEVLSDMVRAALTAERSAARQDVLIRNGVPILAPVSEARLVTSADVTRLLEEG
jgi:plasmid stability protein